MPELGFARANRLAIAVDAQRSSRRAVRERLDASRVLHGIGFGVFGRELIRQHV
jgi:hypothetical protein